MKRYLKYSTKFGDSAGLLISFVAFSVICWVSPLGNVGIGVLYHEESNFEAEGEPETEEEKGPM
jgi:NCS1 family nucleobase:cation symporter-1